MPKCKNCGEEISKFDKDVCPFCGCKNPLDNSNYETHDITQLIDKVEINEKGKNSSKKLFHKRWITCLLCTLLGIFGADSFYLGFIKLGILRIIANILIYIFVFLILYLTTDWVVLALVIPLALIYLVNIIGAIYIWCNKSYKDKNGVFLK